MSWRKLRYIAHKCGASAIPIISPTLFGFKNEGPYKYYCDTYIDRKKKRVDIVIYESYYDETDDCDYETDFYEVIRLPKGIARIFYKTLDKPVDIYIDKIIDIVETIINP